MDARVLFVAELISGNPGYTYWLDELAEKVKITPCHLAHLFKAETGTTIRQHIINVRIRAAARMLEHGSLGRRRLRRSSGLTTATFGGISGKHTESRQVTTANTFSGNK